MKINSDTRKISDGEVRKEFRDRHTLELIALKESHKRDIEVLKERHRNEMDSLAELKFKRKLE